MKTNLTLVVMAALSGVAGTAAADAYSLQQDLDRAAREVERWHVNSHQTIADGPLAPCKAAVAGSKKEGIPGDKQIFGTYYKYIPGSVAATGPGGAATYAITWSQAGTVCTELESALRLSPLSLVLGTAKGQIGDPASPHLKNGAPANAVRWEKQGKECLAAVDAAYAAGVKPTDIARFNGAELTIADARTAACEGLIAWAAAYPGLVEKAKQGDLEANIKPWRDAGFKGQRLEAFAERGPDIDGWYVKGCKEPKSRAQLKTAAVAFQWFYPPDGGHLIRKYTFKGDKLVSVTERSYLTEAKAYAGCK